MRMGMHMGLTSQVAGQTISMGGRVKKNQKRQLDAAAKKKSADRREAFQKAFESIVNSHVAFFKEATWDISYGIDGSATITVPYDPNWTPNPNQEATYYGTREVAGVATIFAPGKVPAGALTAETRLLGLSASRLAANNLKGLTSEILKFWTTWDFIRIRSP